MFFRSTSSMDCSQVMRVCGAIYWKFKCQQKSICPIRAFLEREQEPDQEWAFFLQCFVIVLSRWWCSMPLRCAKADPLVLFPITASINMINMSKAEIAERLSVAIKQRMTGQSISVCCAEDEKIVFIALSHEIL